MESPSQGTDLNDWNGPTSSCPLYNKTHRNTSSVTNMLEHLQWETLESRSTKQHLILLSKIVNNLVDVLAKDYLTPVSAQSACTRLTHIKKFQWFSPKLTLSSLASFLKLYLELSKILNSVYLYANCLLSYLSQKKQLSFILACRQT